MSVRKKRIKRKPGVKSKNYFTQETDAAIKQWQETDCPESKKTIYTKGIAPAFDALVTNLIWVYGFKVPRESPAAVHQDCVTFLYESLHKWDPGYGAKAFSYFNITAKRWLINRSRKALKENKRSIGITDRSELSTFDWDTVESHAVIESPDEILSKAETPVILSKLIEELGYRIRTENEKIALNGLKYLFENAESLDIFNKRSIIVYLREITGLEKSDLSSAMSSIRKNYRDITGGTGIFTYEFWED